MLSTLVQHKLLIALLVAVGARLAVLFAFPGIFAYTEPGVAIQGSVAYDEYARNLLETGVYGRAPGVADAGLPPLYSLAVALVYGLFGRHYLALCLAQILADAVSIALLFDICRRLFPDHGDDIGAVAGLAFALYPYLIFQNLTVNDTALWILLLHLFVWLLIRLREHGALWLGLAAGVVLGLSVLMRSLLPPLAILAALWFWLGLGWRETIKRLAPVAIVSVAVVLPWLVRAYGVYGGFVPIALNSGENIYQGNNPQSLPIFRAGYDVQWVAPLPDAPPASEPLRRNSAMAEAGWAFLRDNPDIVPQLLLAKFQALWNVEITPRNNLREGERLVVDSAGEVQIVTGEGSHIGVSAANAAYQDSPLFNLMRGAHIVYFGGLWLLAVGGVWLKRRDWRTLCLLYFVQISQTAVYLVFHPSTRYRSPTDPLLFVFSAAAVVWVWGRFVHRRESGLRE